jgi:hypothetical protein
MKLISVLSLVLRYILSILKLLNTCGCIMYDFVAYLFHDTFIYLVSSIFICKYFFSPLAGRRILLLNYIFILFPNK